MCPKGNSEVKQQLRYRLDALKRVQYAVSHYMNEPPYPYGMQHIINDLRGLEDHVQNSGQRETRESLIAACEAYITKNTRGDKKTLTAIQDAWRSFDYSWGPNEIGELILPNGM
jgi:hypothetical protein